MYEEEAGQMVNKSKRASIIAGSFLTDRRDTKLLRAALAETSPPFEMAG